MSREPRSPAGLTQRRLASQGPRWRSSIPDLGLAARGVEGSFDSAGDLVDCRGEPLDPLERVVGVPASEVGDALAPGVQARAGADDAGDAFDDQLCFGAAELRVVDTVRVGELVYESRDLRVVGQVASDRDPGLAA
jgi:hypothetical protein